MAQNLCKCSGASMGSDWVKGFEGAAPPDTGHGLDELVAGVAIKVSRPWIIGPLILPADGLQLVPLPLRQAQGFLHQGVPLDELDGAPGGQGYGRRRPCRAVSSPTLLWWIWWSKAVVRLIIRFNGDAHVHLPVRRRPPPTESDCSP